ncbi:LysR family transcriptional regulator [Paracoccus sp. (in: a-proteobacteria)]|uniref:LysR family transcriptional regulator n=1 Tax=Paracoccus sp. TaxID=267 RepID=UPI003A88C137
MNWDDLQPFLALIREGSLSGAARHLRVEHATVARRMDRLELALGLRLFDRLPRGWRPTPEALALVERAEAAEAALFDLRRLAGGGAEGVVRLSAPPLLAAELLAPRLGPFLAAYPGIQLEIDADAQRADLGRGEVDLALRIGPVEGQTLRLRRLGQILYRPYGLDPKAGVIRPRDARTETERWMHDWSGSRPVVLDTADTSVMRAAVAAGYGIALLPDFYAGDLPPVGEAFLSRPLHLTLHEDKARAPRVRLVADMLVDFLGAWFHE